ncbi:MAG TPA: DNA-processing protein DprA [Ktedonobacteraceae bacterium]
MQVEHIIHRGDIHYPRLFANWQQAPSTLYCAGNVALLNETCVAVIGTRQPTKLGWQVAYSLSRALAAQDVVIVSGLALGCDTVAHKGALAAHGKTIAVLATPLSHIYPSENTVLAEEIVRSGGLVLSAYNTQDRCAAWQFVERDAVQAALSRVVIPVQAGHKSGTRHAVQWALHDGRTVAVPRPVEKDRVQYPDKYELIEALMKRHDVMVIEGKQDYPRLLESVVESIK